MSLPAAYTLAQRSKSRGLVAPESCNSDILWFAAAHARGSGAVVRSRYMKPSAAKPLSGQSSINRNKRISGARKARVELPLEKSISPRELLTRTDNKRILRFQADRRCWERGSVVVVWVKRPWFGGLQCQVPKLWWAKGTKWSACLTP